MTEKPHRSGFVSLIGRPNAGKSTLMNVLVGERLSIVTPKAQTTRHRIRGILNAPDYQIVFSDTPGIVKAAYKLHESMMKAFASSLEDADVIVSLNPVQELPDAETLDALRKSTASVIVAVSKCDSVPEAVAEQRRAAWEKEMPGATVLAVSALKEINLGTLLEAIVEKLPEFPPYFPKEELTDRPERFFISEIIREKVLMNYDKEVPYAVEVVVEEYKEEEKIVRIRAVVITERESQKGIIIGRKGAALKEVGTQARLDIERFVGKKVFLEMFVKVSKGWRNREAELKRFGYE